MNRNRFLSVLLVVLFLVGAGTSKVYCQLQRYTMNYFVHVQSTCAIPDRIDKNTLTEEDKEEMEEYEYEEEDCDDDEEDNYGSMGVIFEAGLNKTTLMLMLQMQGMTVREEGDFIVIEESSRSEMAINLDEHIIEMRSLENEDNPFFDETGNKLWGVFRINFIAVGSTYIPEKLTAIEYDVLPSGIPYKTTQVTTYLYYERLDENDSTVLKWGDENLYKQCMGYTTQIKELPNLTENISIYPNPANETIRLSLPSYMNENADIKIFNTLGVTVLSQHHTQGENINIDINSLPAGVYVVRCMKNDKIISKLFVKE